jgi:hypothetical protein
MQVLVSGLDPGDLSITGFGPRKAKTAIHENFFSRFRELDVFSGGVEVRPKLSIEF